MTPERTERIHSVLNHRQPDLVVLMEHIEDMHNIAAVMRSCDAVGVQEVFVVCDDVSRYDYFGKRSSSSAASWLTVHLFDALDNCVAALKKRGLKIWATHLGSDAVSLYEADLTEPVALAFGNEWKGISPELLAHCDGNFVIPQVGMVRSLNVSVACAVSLYEALRQRTLKGMYKGEPRLAPDAWQELGAGWGLPSE